MLGTHTKRDFGPICIHWSISTPLNAMNIVVKFACKLTQEVRFVFSLQPSFQCRLVVLEYVTPNPLPPIVCILSGHVVILLISIIITCGCPNLQ
jgi:hypothetical protein